MLTSLDHLYLTINIMKSAALIMRLPKVHLVSEKGFAALFIMWERDGVLLLYAPHKYTAENRSECKPENAYKSSILDLL